MNILVSSGLGRLHLDKVASILKNHTNEDVTFITGAIPNKTLAVVFFTVFGKFIYGRKHIADRLHLRIPAGIERQKVRSLYVPDIVLFIGLLLSKLNIASANASYSLSYFLFGVLSSLHMKKFDVVYIRAGAGSRIIKKAKIHGKLVIVDYSSAHPNDIYHSLKQSGSINALHTFEERRGLWNQAILDVEEADIVVVNSPYVLTSLVRNGVEQEKIVVNNLPIDIGKIPCKDSYKLSSRINIGYSGRFVSWKGCDVLLEVIDNLSYRYSNITLHIYGIIEGHYYGNELFAKLLKSGNIVEYGLVQHPLLFNHIRDMDIYTFLSYSEGSAQSVKEAMAIGLPVVCTEASGSPITNDVNGLICENNIEACSSAIINLLENDEKRSRLGVAAREEIKNNHNGIKFVSVLKTLLKR